MMDAPFRWLNNKLQNLLLTPTAYCPPPQNIKREIHAELHKKCENTKNLKEKD